MDRLIHKTLDNRQTLHDQLREDVDGLFKRLDLKAVILDPETVLKEFAEQVSLAVTEKYGPAYVEEGISFAQAVIAKRTPIVVDDSTNPNLNKDQDVKSVSKT